VTRNPSKPTVGNSLWHTQDGQFAHFDSRAGSGGPGRFRVARITDTSAHLDSGIPHPHSRASRFELFTANEHKKRIGSGKSAKPAPAPHAREVNVFGTFPSDWNGASDRAIADAAAAENWFPGTDDMKRFARPGTAPGTTTLDVKEIIGLLRELGEIGRKNPHSIRRLNFFAHGANDGTIWVSGRVTRTNVDFVGDRFSLNNQSMMELEADDVVLLPLKKGTRTKGDAERGWQENITLRDVRQAFSADAVVVVYACHSAIDEGYLRRIGKLLGARIQGFRKMTVWKLTWNENKQITRRQFGLDGSTRFVEDFHQLPPDIDIPRQ
jgi:hypothetical protein